MREKKILRKLEFETIYFCRRESRERERRCKRDKSFFVLFGYLVFLDIPCVIS